MATPVLTPDKGEQLKRDIRNAVITVLIGAVIWFIPVPVGLKAVTWHLFAIFVAVIAGFILNPLPMGAVSMIALSFATITNTVSLGDALSGFSDAIIWLVVSSFLFAKAFIKTGLATELLIRLSAPLVTAR
jgi:DASS family divalent anion:Na+ symporter